MEIDFFGSSSGIRSAGDRLQRLKDVGMDPRITDSYMDFGVDYFDNPDLDVGYGSFQYDGRYQESARKMVDYYKLPKESRVLELGCAKGFVLVEFQKLGMEVCGLDYSAYAVENCHPDLKGRMLHGKSSAIPFEADSFDFVYSKEMLPHIPTDEVPKVLSEINRVAQDNCFLEVQSGLNDTELKYMKIWDQTHQTLRTPEWWQEQFLKTGYRGDFYFKRLFVADPL